MLALRASFACLFLSLAVGCGNTVMVVDAGPDRGLMAPVPAECGCTAGLHSSRIFVLSDTAELWTYDPLEQEFEFIVGPVCATALTPYSMGIDPKGVAYILDVPSRRLQTIDVNDIGACEDSGFVPTVRDVPLFGMSFVLEDVDRQCAGLYGQSYDGEGAFEEAEDIGSLVRIAGDPLRMEVVGSTDFNGGELAGTGDGRLFGFAGERPAKLVEYDLDGAVVAVLPLDGVSQTNASAFAFFGGDIYLFTEAQPPGCAECFEAECPDAYAACLDEEVCVNDLACAIEAGDVRDDCGGLTGEAMQSCLIDCNEACLTNPRARPSQLTRIDWDRSDPEDERIVVEVEAAPIRVVGAASSPCVPVVPD